MQKLSHIKRIYFITFYLFDRVTIKQNTSVSLSFSVSECSCFDKKKIYLAFSKNTCHATADANQD